MEEPRGPLRLERALALALLYHPDLAAASWEVRVAEAGRLQAGLTPNPELRASVEQVGGSLPGFSQSEITVLWSHLIELGGKRAAAVRVAEHEQDLRQWEFEMKRLEVYAEVTRRFILQVGFQRQVSFNRETVRLAEEVVETIAKKVKAAAASSVEEQRAKVLLATAHIELARAEREVAVGRQRLVSMWGSTIPQFSEAQGDLEQEMLLPTWEDVIVRLKRNPDVARWAVEMTRRQEVVHLAQASGVPDVIVGGGYKRLNAAPGLDTFVMEVSLPLPLFHHNQGAIQAAEASMAKAREEQRGAEVNVTTALREAYDTLVTAWKEVQVFQKEVLPGAQAAFEGIQEGYRIGRFPYLSLLEAQKTLAEVKGQSLKAWGGLHQARIAIEQLTGESLESIAKEKP